MLNRLEIAFLMIFAKHDFLNSHFVPDAKRARMSPSEIHDDSSSNDDSEEKRTPRNSPPLIVPQPPLNLPLNLPHPMSSPPERLTSPATPESRDLDVEDEQDTDAPENLSLKKPSTPETPPSSQNSQNGANNLLQQSQQMQHHQSASPQTPSFLPYHHFAPQYQPFQQTTPQYPLQRSPVDILLRVFPGRRRSDVEALLQR